MWHTCATNSVGLMWQAMSQLALQRMVLSAQCCCPDSWWPCTCPTLSTTPAAHGGQARSLPPFAHAQQAATFTGPWSMIYGHSLHA